MLDPACGSMHFGLYAFDLFEVIYDEAWELEERFGADTLSPSAGDEIVARDAMRTKEEFLKDVPRLIIEHNLHGIDIDPRCAQIAGLSLWLRAQKSLAATRPQAGGAPGHQTLEHRLRRADAGRKGVAARIRGKRIPAAERAVFLRLLEAIFDKMQLAGEAGSLLKIEEEIRSAIAEAKQRWQKGRRPESGRTLFLANDRGQQTSEMKLRLISGITD